MTPAARVQAAIEILDIVLDGAPAEQALTRWARGNRYAGSGDRRAVRDHVFDVLRRKRALVCRGGGTTGRALMIGLMREQGVDLADVFTGSRHQPAPLDDHERASGAEPALKGDRWNLPEWLVPEFETSLGAGAEAQCLAMGQRAPVFVRVNALKSGPEAAITALAEDGITAVPHPRVHGALTLTNGARRLRNSAAFRDGLVEPQDAASQAIVAGLPDLAGPILDLCAGGGGKTLALAARFGRAVDAWDLDPARMADLPVRATRAGADVRCLTDRPGVEYALVLADAPCSGSGSWRRNPDAKWLFSQEKLDALTATQDAVLDHAADCVAPDGLLAYATCSVLTAENEACIAAFLARHPDWRCGAQFRWPIGPDGDGFFAAHLMRA